MSRIDEDAVVHLLKDAVGEAPYPPDRVERIIATAGAQRHRRATQALGSMCVGLAVLGSVIAIDRSPTTRAPEDVLTTALASAEDVGTVRMEGTMTTSAPGTTYLVRFSGSVDFRGGATDLEVVLELDGRASELRRYRLVGGYQYASITPEMSAAYSAGKRWIRSPADASDAASEATDPQAAMATLRSASKEIERVGRETVRGVRTTRYRFHTTPAKYTPTTFFGSEGGIVEAWIDDDNLPRRVSTTVEISAKGVRPSSSGSNDASDSDDRASSTATYDFFDYGVQVDIDAPPAAEVIDSDDPLLKAPSGMQQCITERLKELAEELQAKYAAGDGVPQEEIKKLYEELDELCRGGE